MSDGFPPDGFPPDGFPTLADELRRLGFEDSGAEGEPPGEVPALFPRDDFGREDGEELDDAELFRRAVGGVRPLRSNVVQPRRVPDPTDRPDTEDSVLWALADLCRRGSVSLRAQREYVEEWVAPQGRLYLDDLGRGRFAIQAHLDLHGLDLASARQELESFIVASVRDGRRAVRIVHGRGRHSPDGRARMKESVERWLRERRLGRFVLAFTSARKADGGCGAVYVLLRGD